MIDYNYYIVILDILQNYIFILNREREREKKVGGVVRETTVLKGGCNRNIIWQFGRFPGSAR
jgi:hypothetical protein